MSSNPTKGKAGAFVLNYSDKKHSIPASHTSPHTLRGQTAAQRGTWFSRRSLSKEAGLSERHRVTSVSALLPAPRVSSHALVSLSHTLLITAMAGLLSQKNVFFRFSFLGATCLHEAALRSYSLILRRNLPAFDSKLCRWSLRLLWRTGQSVCHLLPRKFKKARFFFEFPFWRVPWTPKLALTSFTHFLAALLSCSLWPMAPLFHTAVYYFDQYPPFPLLLLPLSLSLSLSLPPLN